MSAKPHGKKVIKKKKKVKKEEPLLIPPPVVEAEPQDFNEFQLGPKLGRGAFGCVYQGLNKDTGIYVAIKTISLIRFPDALDSVQQEISLMASLDHPNIVKYITSHKTKDFLYIVMEFAEGGSLQNVQKKFENFNEHLASKYLYEVLLGLKYLHEQSIIHRDIKAANILLTKGHCKLSDFGISVKLTDNNQNQDPTACSPFWAAPEVLSMEPSTEKCDIWSLGITAIELFTGQPPYFELNPMRAMFQIVQNPEPPLPKDITSNFKDFLTSCLTKNVTFRKNTEQLLNHIFILEHNGLLTDIKYDTKLKRFQEDAKVQSNLFNSSYMTARIAAPSTFNISSNEQSDETGISPLAAPSSGGNKTLSSFSEKDSDEMFGEDLNIAPPQPVKLSSKSSKGLSLNSFTETDDSDDAFGKDKPSKPIKLMPENYNKQRTLSMYKENESEDRFANLGLKPPQPAMNYRTATLSKFQENDEDDFNFDSDKKPLQNQPLKRGRPSLSNFKEDDDDMDDFSDLKPKEKPKPAPVPILTNALKPIGKAAGTLDKFKEEDSDDFDDLKPAPLQPAIVPKQALAAKPPSKPKSGLDKFKDDSDDDFGDLKPAAAAPKPILKPPQKPKSSLDKFKDDSDDDFGDLKPAAPKVALNPAQKPKSGLDKFKDDDDDDDDFGDLKKSAPNSNNAKPSSLDKFKDDDDDDFDDLKPAAPTPASPSRPSSLKPPGGLAKFKDDDDDDFGDLDPPTPASPTGYKPTIAIGSDAPFRPDAKKPTFAAGLQSGKKGPMKLMDKGQGGGLQIQPKPPSGGLQIQPKPPSGGLQIQPKSGGLQIQPTSQSEKLHIMSNTHKQQKKNIDELLTGIFSTEEDNAVQRENELMDTVLNDLDLLIQIAEQFKASHEDEDDTMRTLDSSENLIATMGTKRRPNEICAELLKIIQENPKLRANLGVRHGLIPILSVVQYDIPDILEHALPVIIEVVRDQPALMRSFCIMGIVPPLLKYAEDWVDDRRFYGPTVQMNALKLISYICALGCNVDYHLLQLFVSAGGLPGLTNVFRKNKHTERPETTPILIGCVRNVFMAPMSTPKSAISRIFAQAGLIDLLAERYVDLDDDSDMIPYLAELFIIFSEADTIVRLNMATPKFIDALFTKAEKVAGHENKLKDEVLVMITRAINNITMDQAVAKALWNTKLCNKLLDYLRVDQAEVSMTQLVSNCFSALFNMTRCMTHNEASEIAPLIPMLVYIIKHQSLLTELAKTVFLDLIKTHSHDSKVRQRLITYNALGVLYSLFHTHNHKDQVLNGFETWALQKPQQVQEELMKHVDFPNICAELITTSVGTTMQADCAAKILSILEKCPELAISMSSSEFVATLMKVLRGKVFRSHPEILLSTFNILALFVDVTPTPKSFFATYRVDEIAQKYRNDSIDTVKEVAMRLVRSLASNYIL